MIKLARIGSSHPIECIVTIFCAVTLVYFKLLEVSEVVLLVLLWVNWIWERGGRMQRGMRRARSEASLDEGGTGELRYGSEGCSEDIQDGDGRKA